MSAIAHWIEQHGISTVVIGLVRLHLEKVLPPRSLWVPFELGRPLGAPGDVALQQSVLRQALQLVETTTPRQIVDFNGEDSGVLKDPAWQAPVTTGADSVVAESAMLRDAYDRQVRASERTSVGVAGVSPEQCAQLIDQMIEHNIPSASTREGISDLLMLRLAIDDIKACYIEAALAPDISLQDADKRSVRRHPSSRQIHNWFWHDTFAGEQLRHLRERMIASDDPKVVVVGRGFIIPHRWRLSA